jgi:hypothetical protein
MVTRTAKFIMLGHAGLVCTNRYLELPEILPIRLCWKTGRSSLAQRRLSWAGLIGLLLFAVR